MTCSNESFAAFTKIWFDNECKTEILPICFKLWHCGAISSLADVDPNKALFTTQCFDRRMIYAKNALGDAKFYARQASLLSLQLKQQIKVANFNKASLETIFENYCQHNHPAMTQTLRQWCLDQKLDGVMSLNRSEDEVFIVRPIDSLAFLNFEPI